jgi:hypothetical protein
MVWKQDLAKLKQDLKAQEVEKPVPARVVPSKTAQQPITPRSLEDEDALFLASVGRVAANTPKPTENPAKPKPTANTQMPAEHTAEFHEAMSRLGGIKPKVSGVPISLDAKEPGVNSELLPTLSPEKISMDISSPPMSETATIDNPDSHDNHDAEKSVGATMSFPQKIQLAAGMTIEVDGQLDLRNHSAEDARERLMERVLDGQCLGWRSLHLILGNSKQLHQVFTDYINSPQSHPLTKYAQAPVPMGGTQAWVLYYSHNA